MTSKSDHNIEQSEETSRALISNLFLYIHTIFFFPLFPRPTLSGQHRHLCFFIFQIGLFIKDSMKTTSTFTIAANYKTYTTSPEVAYLLKSLNIYRGHSNKFPSDKKLKRNQRLTNLRKKRKHKKQNLKHKFCNYPKYAPPMSDQ